jgi:hypothetical protein
MSTVVDPVRRLFRNPSTAMIGPEISGIEVEFVLVFCGADGVGKVALSVK